MRHATILLLGLCGCASVQTPEDTTMRQTAIFTSAETGTLLGDQPHASRATIAAAPATVWLAAKKLYLDLEIPVTVESPATHQIGNSSFYKTRQMVGQPMTQFVDCGGGMDGPKAASYRIYISLITSIQADDKGGTVVQTTFVPVGQDMSGGSSDRIACGTTGRLESYFIERLTAMVAKS